MLLLLVIPAFGQVADPGKEKLDNIRRLLVLMGSEKIQKDMFDQMMAALRPLMTGSVQGDQRAQRVMDRFEQLMSEEFKKSDLLGLTIQLYDKHFTHEDIKGLIQFYETPVGKKALKVLPILTQEAMVRGMEVGQRSRQRAFERLVVEFPELRSVLTGPAARD